RGQNGRGEGLFEEGENTLAFAILVPGGVPPGEPIEGFHDPRVDVNEPAIEVSKPQKRLYFFDILQWRPVENGLDLGWVHTYAIWSNNNSKVFDLHGVEGALLGFGMEVVLLELF
ncbi:hypothetical protein J132_08973, partial [Termitomyces sp. J132]